MLAPRIAVVSAGLSVVLAVVDTALVVAAHPLLSTESVGIHGWPLVNAAALGSAVLGAAILGSHPRHPIGWLLNVVGLTTSISLAAESFSVWVLEYDGPGTDNRGHLAGWLAALLGGPLALVCLTVVFLLVPTGTYLAPGWRWAARTAWAGYGAFVLGLVLTGPHGIDWSGRPRETGPAADVMTRGGLVLITLMVLASVVSMVLRLRHSTGVVRQQLRVVATGAASVGIALVALIVTQSLNGGRQSWQSSVPLYASYAFLLACIAVAVLRYRLYDVELIFSRALVLAIATAFVAVGYVGVVVTLGRIVEHHTHGSFWLSLLATVVVALAFQPARRRVVRVADRLAYGTRAAPYDALADLSRQIGHSPAPDELLPTIAAAAGEAVDAARVTVRLDGDEDTGLTAIWPPGAEARGAVDTRENDVVVPIRDASGPLGSIGLTLPPGRGVRPPEHRLLTDIAEQAALALRNVRLQLELAARVRQLDQRTRELTASRNRIIGAADTERRRLEAALARQVLPTMMRLRGEVEDAATSSAPAARIGDCVDRATEALESLRELTRGIYPTMLTRSGIGPALSSYAARMQRPDAVRIDPAVAVSRFSPRVEATAYFCCVEVLEQAPRDVSIALSRDGDDLVVSVRGMHLDMVDRLTIVDRIGACEGSLDVAGIDADSSLLIRLPAAAWPLPDEPTLQSSTAAPAGRG